MAYIKINKSKAKKLFDEGKEIFLLPSKTVIGSMWINPILVNNKYERSFDSLLNEFSYYNCNSEVGRNIHYYIYN